MHSVESLYKSVRGWRSQPLCASEKLVTCPTHGGDRVEPHKSVAIIFSNRYLSLIESIPSPSRAPLVRRLFGFEKARESQRYTLLNSVTKRYQHE